MLRSLRWLATFIAGEVLVSGHMAAQVTDAAQTITARDIEHHVGVIAADSMLGRDTPSKGLESTARYVAQHFERLGLKPVNPTTEFGRRLGQTGRVSTWFQRYRVPAQFDFARSYVVFAAGSHKALAGFATAARLAHRSLPTQPVQATALLIAGGHTVESLQQVDMDDKIVLYVPSRLIDPDAQSRVADWLARRSRGLVVLAEEDSATFSRRLQVDFHRLIRQSRRGQWEAYVRPAAVAGLQSVFAAVGLDLAQVRAETKPVTRDLPSLQVAFEAQFKRTSDDTTTAPNVVGVLAGSDPKLKDEYIVLTAHMDYLGVRGGQADSINNGVNDNASGVAGLLALVNAFSQPGARPRRSMMFVATSGGMKPGFWGSSAFSEGLYLPDPARLVSPSGAVSALKAVANINLDMLGGLMRDSVMVDGLMTMNFAVPPAWIAATYPELRLTIVDGGSVFNPQSDHFALVSNQFLRLPSLSIHTGRHHGVRQETDSAVTLDADQVARIVRFVFYVSQQIANVDRTPQWNAEGRREMLESLIPR